MRGGGGGISPVMATNITTTTTTIMIVVSIRVNTRSPPTIQFRITRPIRTITMSTVTVARSTATISLLLTPPCLVSRTLLYSVMTTLMLVPLCDIKGF